MTDLEMTRWCADAVGLVGYAANGRHLFKGSYAAGTYEMYDPLRDDEQAMALLRKCELSLCAPSPDDKRWYVLKIWTSDSRTISAHDENLSRAIVECVSRMQSAKSKEATC